MSLRSRVPFPFVPVLLSGLLLPLFAGAGPVPRVAVPRLDAKDAAPEIGVALSELVAFELEETGRYAVVTNDDIAKVLELKGKQQQLGCDTPACVADLATSVEVEQLVSGTVTKFGRRYLIILKLLDATNASVVKQVRGQVAAKEELLIDTVGDLTRQLVAKTEIARAEPVATAPPPAAKAAKADDAVATGDLLGSASGDPFGAGGLGLSGTGRGGGGVGEGTIGLGSIGTIGRGGGTGTGSGYGSGLGAGGAPGRKTSDAMSRQEELRLAMKLSARLKERRAKKD